MVELVSTKDALAHDCQSLADLSNESIILLPFRWNLHVYLGFEYF